MTKMEPGSSQGDQTAHDSQNLKPLTFLESNGSPGPGGRDFWFDDPWWISPQLVRAPSLSPPVKPRRVSQFQTGLSLPPTPVLHD